MLSVSITTGERGGCKEVAGKASIGMAADCGGVGVWQRP